jgi:hypothetical protein
MHIHDLQIAFGQLEVGKGRNRNEECYRFNVEGHCVTSLYRHCLNDSIPPSVRLISVSLPQSECDPGNNWANQGATEYFIKWHHVLGRHFALGEFDRKQNMLELTHDVLTWMAKRAAWSLAPFRAARRECLDRNIENHLFWKEGKRWRSPNKKYFAKILWDFGLTDIKIDAVIETKDRTELGRCLLATIPADELSLFDALHSFQWISDERISLKSKSSKSWTRSIKSITTVP